EASNAKDEFLATVSHELRTPMTATLGWVRMLNLGHFDAETQKTALDAIERSTRAQAKLIEDILDVSSIVLGKFRLDLEPVDLRGVVDAAIETLRPASEAKQIAVDVDTSRWSGTVQGDADRLQQVIWNLVSNAIKFGRRGGHIGVTVERIDGHARISVADDGPGIDSALLPLVFDRFWRADSGARRTYGGLGLGLSIVRHLTELHGGTVSVTSDGADKGSTFIVDLPSAAVAQRPD
ncbi:MAG TPA: HAMP domain-containing sensor histidine kinase, partial [Thermoanaerobaculia bacterium]